MNFKNSRLSTDGIPLEVVFMREVEEVYSEILPYRYCYCPSPSIRWEVVRSQTKTKVKWIRLDLDGNGKPISERLLDLNEKGLFKRKIKEYRSPMEMENFSIDIGNKIETMKRLKAMKENQG